LILKIQETQQDLTRTIKGEQERFSRFILVHLPKGYV